MFNEEQLHQLSLKAYGDNQNAMEYMFQKGYEKGLKKGLKQGYQKTCVSRPYKLNKAFLMKERLSLPVTAFLFR